MPSFVKSIIALSLVVVVAACGKSREEEYVVVEPQIISMEPAYTGKFK